jgi:hypothetical protein
LVSNKYKVVAMFAKRFCFLVTSMFFFGCPGPDPINPSTTQGNDVAGQWRVLSARIYYDEGGGGDLSSTITQRLNLSSTSTWSFSTSSGSFDLSSITNNDWTRWGVNSYGPARKIVLQGWNASFADGPIDESNGTVDYLWVIYHVEPPTVSNAGTIWLKFGRQ